MQTPLLLWAGRSGVIRSTAFRPPGARQILHKGLGDVGYLGWSTLAEDVSRHRPLTILDDGRAPCKVQVPINAAATWHRIVKQRGALAGRLCGTEAYSILLLSMEPDQVEKVSIRSRG